MSFKVFSWVFFKNIGHPFPASTAFAYHPAHTHQLSRSFNPGNEVKMSSGKVTIQKVNDMGKPVRVAFKLDQDNFNKNTLFLKFDEIKNTYNIIK